MIAGKASNIILTGFMGTGKTTVGKLLAQKLGRSFVDTDHYIEQSQGKSIPEIFAQDEGEECFRALERQAAEELGKKTQLVISTGGRLMLDPVNAAALGENGEVFCLIAEPETILARVGADGISGRPLLHGDNPEKRIADLMEERQQAYSRFTCIATDSKTAEAVAHEICSLFSSR